MRPNLESTATLIRCFLRQLVIRLWRFFSTLTAVIGIKFSHSLTNCLLMALSVTGINKLSAKYIAKIEKNSIRVRLIKLLFHKLTLIKLHRPSKSPLLTRFSGRKLEIVSTFRYHPNDYRKTQSSLGARVYSSVCNNLQVHNWKFCCYID